MRIGIDAHHVNGKPQGSRTHLVDLIRALARAAGSSGDEIRVYSFRPEETKARLGAGVPHLVHRRLFPASARARIPFVVPALELLDRLSVFHSQYIVPPFSFVPEVVTIHDVLFESHPHLFRGAFSLRSVRLIRRSARRARVVLTVSEFSRREIVERYAVDEAAVLVTPNGVDRERFRPARDPEEERELRARYRLDGPYVLNVGRIEPRKNLERLFHAFGRARERIDPRLRLAVAGARDFGHERILAEAAFLGDGVRHLGAVPDEDLPGLYRAAEALAYPSLAEGFGMPLLEAMACGTPVLCSRGGALPEVAAEAALYVEAESEESLAEGLERIVTDTGLREELREAGLGRARRFSWEETARKTLGGYRLAAGEIDSGSGQC